MSRLAFKDHCELCDTVYRRHGNADEAGHGPLASRLAKFKIPLVGSVRRKKKDPSVELGAVPSPPYLLAGGATHILRALFQACFSSNFVCG